MPSATPQLYQYSHVPETKEELDWADLTNIDLSKYGTPEGNAELSRALIEAVRRKGFFYVTNFGISQQAVDRQFALGQAFYGLPLEEKLKYVPNLDAGEYNGYRPAGRRPLAGGVREKTEVWNMATNDGHITQPLPDLLKEQLDEIETFAKVRPDYWNLSYPNILTLIGLARQGPRPPQPPHRSRPRTPPDYFVNLHKWTTHDESHLRYMKYSKFSAKEIEALEDGLWSHGHTDLGTLTLLFRQPVAGLQIRDYETESWKWAKPLDGSLTVNAGDAYSFLTGGYIKSTIHRVSVPPKDQRHVDRLGLLYFARTQNDVALKTVDSPVLKREGFTQNEFEAGGHPTPTMGEFTRLKQTWQQKKGVSHEKHDGVEIVPGFAGKYFT
ncbi:flavonol synthase [Dactylonectria estremocensis]|uniref:Flavonol synthase n=1 Tax=Dactylonectria estremocensis TaxID=1079267 RepID=A0A9P9FFC6_9HYPO|nr:flavonol synthase [Dactylonectria estremocensis]